MKRELLFANLGKILVILGFVLYAGCVLPATQEWCVLVCLDGMSQESDGISANHCAKITDGSSGVACHTPSSTDMLVITHNSEEWAPNFAMPMASIPEARFAPQTKSPNIEFPELSIFSPPPESSSLV